jgi:hypothetical protein
VLRESAESTLLSARLFVVPGWRAGGREGPEAAARRRSYQLQARHGTAWTTAQTRTHAAAERVEGSWLRDGSSVPGEYVPPERAVGDRTHRVLPPAWGEAPPASRPAWWRGD